MHRLLKHIALILAPLCLLAACLLECGMVCARTVDVPAGEEEKLTDALSGTEDLVKTGGGTLVLAGSTSGWTGPIDVREGTLSCSPKTCSWVIAAGR